MEIQDHKIQRLNFNVHIQEKESVASVQNRLSQLTDKVLTKLIGEILNEFSDAEYYVAIPSLELDLGDIPVEELEKEFPAKIETALRLALKNHFLKYPDRFTPANAVKVEDPLLSIFSFYLEHGSFPWWKPAKINASPSKMLHQLLLEKPKLLQNKIAALSKKEKVIDRLSLSFKTKDQEAIIQLFYPKQALRILSFVKDFQLIFKTNPLKNIAHHNFRKLLWKSLLAYLLKHTEHDFEEQKFMADILLDLSQRTGVAIGDWIEQSKKPADLSSSFVQLIHKLEDQEVINLLQTKEIDVPEWVNTLLEELREPGRRTAKKILSYYLEQNKIPLLKTEDLKHLTFVVGKIWEYYPSLAVELIDSFLADKYYREKSLQIFSSSLIKKSLQFKFPLLFVHLTNLSQDLLRTLKPFFQGESSLELEKKIWNHYLIYFSLNKGKAFDFKELVKNTLIALAGPQHKSYVILLKTIQRNFPKSAERVYFDSNLIQYLTLIFEDEGLAQLDNDQEIVFDSFAVEDAEKDRLEQELFGLEGLEDQQHDDLRIFSFYLEHGALLIGLKLKDVRAATVRLIRKDARRLNAWFRKTRSQENVLTRMVSFFNTETLVPLFNLVQPNLGDFGFKLKALLKKLELTPKEDKKGAQFFWKLFKKVSIAQSSEVFSPYHFTKQILTEIIELNLSTQGVAKDYLFALIHEQPKPRWFTDIFPTISSKNKSRPSKPNEEKPRLNHPEKQNIIEKPEAINYEALYHIENGGMVLLWPYISMLFERAGLMENGQFLDMASREKGIYLLEYIVTGNEEISEHQLVLNKVLCAYEISKPIAVEFELSKEWKALCDGLLQAVISNWSILGESSNEALRDSFLKRKAKLAFKEERWYLQVETKGMDVLMKQLPWGISVVNLSWQENNIHVDWKI